MISKKYFNSKAQMCYLQILILIISTIAFSFLIYQSSAPLNEIKNPEKGNIEDEEINRGKNIIKFLGLIILQKIRQPILPMVSAQEDALAGWACCEKNNNGAFCTYRPESECNANSIFQISPTECEETNFCKLGCCIGNSGICSARTAKTNCNGEWFEDASCNIQECKRGCCVLGDESKFITEKNCEIESGFLGIATDFKNDVQTEVSCLYLTGGEVQGACVLETEQDFEITKNCIFTTSSNCDIRKGNFYANTFCSNSNLNTTCTAHNYTGCFESKDEVYWYDSCGNKEDIKESCSIFLGTRCGQYRPNVDTEPDTGDYVCRDLSCNVEIDGKVVNKKNGESWCEYEGCIGEGKDPVGSRHVRHICYFGEEKTEACDDFRNQICVQSDTSLAGGETFSEASCRVNRWRSCYEYNNEEKGMAEKCAENPDCIIKGVHIDEFSFDVCVPNYPPGFEFWRNDPTKDNYDQSRNGEIECSFATQKCPVVYVKRITGWECEINCDCEKSIFTQQMNDLCISLGDCGGYINFNGDYTDDGYTSGAGRIKEEQYKACAEYQPGQKPAEPGNFSFSQILGIPEGVGEGEVAQPNAMLGMLGTGIGAIGLMRKVGIIGGTAAGVGGIAAATSIADLSYVTSTGETFQGIDALAMSADNYLMEGAGQLTIPQVDKTTAIMNLETGQIADTLPNGQTVISDSSTLQGGAQQSGGILSRVPSSVWNALSAIGAGLSVASFLQAGFGIDAGMSYAIGGVVGITTFIGLQAEAAWAGYMGWIGLGLTIASLIMGLGKTKIKYVKFSCMPWQPQTGGLNCDLCNTNDILGVQCSEYRCKSLGQTCEFINPRTEDEKCITNDPNDVSSPKIKPLYNNITPGYEYKNVNDNSFEIKSTSNECIPEYTILNFGIETDKSARCRIGYNITDTYEEMPEFFGGKNSFLTEHKMQLAVPSPSAFKNRYNLTDEEVEALGQINYFVKCENVNGISNTIPFVIRTCVKPGPDLTAPMITKTIPELAYVKYGETEKQIQVYTNEPADCKWDNESNKEYEDMENSMSCLEGFEDYGLFGWPCIANLTGVDVNNKLYFKCKDQPWFAGTINESDRNAMTEDYEYNLQLSNTPLIIEDFRPETGTEIISGIEPVSIELKIRTSGGVDGTSNCKWEGNGYSDDFSELNSNIHIYAITSATRGDYDIKFTCEDKAGNIAENSTSFKIKIDSSGPRIIRIFYSGGLKVTTDENAECRYMLTNKFNWENATSMSGTGLEHTADWQLKTYYVQCKDEYGNKGGKTQIKPYSLMN